MSIFRKKHQPLNYDEIHQYALDLRIITNLRNDAQANTAEWQRYNDMLKIMQLVMMNINGGVVA